MSRGKRLEGVSAPVYLLIGAGITLITIAAVSFLCAVICNITDDPARLTSPMSLVTLILTALISSYLISRLRGEGGVGAAIAVMALFVTVRICVSLVDGGVGMGDLLDCLCYVGVSIAAAFLGQKRQRRRHR